MQSAHIKVLIPLIFVTLIVAFQLRSSIVNHERVQKNIAAATISTPTPTATPTPTLTPTLTSTPTPAPSPTPTPTQSPTPSQSLSKEDETIQIINQKRLAENSSAPALQKNDHLATAAQRQSDSIGPTSACTHTGTDGSTPWSRASDAGYVGFASGEVVACNMSSSQAAVDSWWSSPTHHAILIDPKNTEIGCGWWTNSQGVGWVTCTTGQGKK
jgi:uncharacterized protein YkwD